MTATRLTWLPNNRAAAYRIPVASMARNFSHSCASLRSMSLDRIKEFCHPACMFRFARKFVAVLLAIWLPLFSGNALAEAVVMHSKGGSCHATAQQGGHHSHQASARHQHMHQEHLAANHDLPSSQHNQQDSSCNDHAVCHLVCCGYVAGSVPVMVAAQQADRIFAPYLDSPRTLTLPLFDPPPLARA